MRGSKFLKKSIVEDPCLENPMSFGIFGFLTKVISKVSSMRANFSNFHNDPWNLKFVQDSHSLFGFFYFVSNLTIAEKVQTKKGWLEQISRSDMKIADICSQRTYSRCQAYSSAPIVVGCGVSILRRTDLQWKLITVGSSISIGCDLLGNIICPFELRRPFSYPILKIHVKY